MPLSEVVGADVPVVLISYTSLAEVLWIVASGIMLGILNARHAAVAEEVPYHWQ